MIPGASRARGSTPATAVAGDGKPYPAASEFRSTPLGSGLFARVFRSRDGVWVRKVQKDSLARGLGPGTSISLADRAGRARNTVRAWNALRTDGVPIPEAHAPAGEPGVIYQRYSKGRTWKQLGAASRERARGHVHALRERVEASLVRRPELRALNDIDTDNVRFDRAGNVIEVIDPVMVDHK